MRETDCIKELGASQHVFDITTTGRRSHVSTKEFNLESDHSFADPDEREDTREDQISLVLAGTHREKHAEKQAEYERAPEKWSEQHSCISDALRNSP